MSFITHTLKLIKKAGLFLIIFVWLCSCKDLFQFHPNEVRLDDSEHNINAKNIQKIELLKTKDTIKFVLIGDSQRFYDETEAFVNHVNQQKDIAFVLLAGDITDFGLNKEFRWVNDLLKRLTVPYVAIIGNHDLMANGRMIYNKMFGPENFTFTYSGNKFICLNTNSLEFGMNGTVPDLPWLSRQLSDTGPYKNAFVIAHVPPFSSAFDKKLEQPYASLLASNKKVRLSLYGHQHQFSQSKPYNDGVEYIVTEAMKGREYIIISIWNDKHKIERIPY